MLIELMENRKTKEALQKLGNHIGGSGVPRYRNRQGKVVKE